MLRIVSDAQHLNSPPGCANNHVVSSPCHEPDGRDGATHRRLISASTDTSPSILNRRPSNGDARLDDRLGVAGPSLVRGHRAADQKEVMQCVWLYERALDFDGLFPTIGSEQRRQLLRDMGIEHV